VGGATLLFPSLHHSPALKVGRWHLVESSQEFRLHAGEPFERRHLVESGSGLLAAALALCKAFGRGFYGPPARLTVVKSTYHYLSQAEIVRDNPFAKSIRRPIDSG